MYSEPTISPNFVVRQKRKLFRNPIVIGGIVSIIGLITIALVVVLTGSTNIPEPTPTSAVIAARIVETTPEVATNDPTPQPDVVISAEVMNVSQVVTSDDDTTSSQTVDTETPACSIRPTGDVNVNIRSGPDMQFSLISVLNARQTVDAIAVSDNRWFQIENRDGTVGWVGGSVVDDIGDCATLPQVQTPTCQVKNTTGNRVNLRANPTTDARIIRTLTTDDVLMADGQTVDGWYRVLLNRELGWIYRDVVALSPECKAVATISAEEPVPQPVTSASNLAFNDADCVVESFTGNSVDLHKRPDLSSAVTAKLNKAMKASRLSTNGWYEIDGFGWAFGGDLLTRGLCRLLPTVAPETIRAG